MMAIILLFEKHDMHTDYVILDKTLKGIFVDVWDFYVKHKDLFSCNPNLPFNHIDKNIGTVNDLFSPPMIKLNDQFLVLLKNKEAREVMKKHLITMIN